MGGLTTLALLPGHAATQSEKPMMKAVVIHAYGGPEVLKLEDVPRPEPKDDEILIRVVAASVNPVDVAIRKGYLAELIGDKLPLIPGMDAAGVVEKTGAKISKFKAGDSVYAFFTLASEGGYAQFVVAKESEAAPKPKAVTYVQAAAVPAAASTAWQVKRGTDRADSRWIGRGRTFRDPNRQGARRKSHRDGVDGESRFSQANGCRPDG